MKVMIDNPIGDSLYEYRELHSYEFIRVTDDAGNEYRIGPNNSGGLEVMLTAIGSIKVHPRASNVVYIEGWR